MCELRFSSALSILPVIKKAKIEMINLIHSLFLNI